MYMDEEIVKGVLAQYGFTLEDVVKAAKHKKPIAEQDWIYLTHHMHPPKKASEMETLHHCVMWEKKNEKGKSWEQKHVKDGKLFQHALDTDNPDEVPDILFDHLNNKFKVKIIEIKKIKYAILNGLASVKKTKWSDQDTGKDYDSIS